MEHTCKKKFENEEDRPLLCEACEAAELDRVVGEISGQLKEELRTNTTQIDHALVRVMARREIAIRNHFASLIGELEGQVDALVHQLDCGIAEAESIASNARERARHAEDTADRARREAEDAQWRADRRAR